MSALQLQILLNHICNGMFRNVHFRYLPVDGEIRLHIWHTDDFVNKRFHRSFGPDGTHVDYES